MRFTLLIALCLSAFVGALAKPRIIGGDVTVIENYPYAALPLITVDYVNYRQECGGVILNSRSVLTSASCLYNTSPLVWRIRVGSSYASSGGNVHDVSHVIPHHDAGSYYRQHDVGIFRVLTAFSFGTNIQAGRFAGSTYVVPDNQTVTAIGWGVTSINGELSEQLRHVQTRIVNWNICRSNYNIISMVVNENMICAGNLSEGGEAPCVGDYGGPLLYNSDVVGISTFDGGCGYRNYPSVYMSVARYIDWIQNNA